MDSHNIFSCIALASRPPAVGGEFVLIRIPEDFVTGGHSAPHGAGGPQPGMSLRDVLGPADLPFLQQVFFSSQSTFSAAFEVDGNLAAEPLTGPVCRLLLDGRKDRRSRLLETGWKVAQEAIRTRRSVAREFDAGLRLAAFPVMYREVSVGVVVGALSLPREGTAEFEALSSLHGVDRDALKAVAGMQPGTPEASNRTGPSRLRETAEFLGRIYEARVWNQELLRWTHHLADQWSRAAEIHRSLDLLPILKTLEKYFRLHLDAEKFCVVLQDPEGQAFRCPWSAGLSEPFLRKIEKHFLDCDFAVELSRGVPAVVPDATTDPRMRVLKGQHPRDPFRSAVFFPLSRGKGVLGAVFLFFQEKRGFRQEELEIGQEQVHHAAIAIANARKYQSESTLGRVLVHLKDALVLTDPEFRIRFVNPAAERIFGFSLSELRGRPFSSLFSPEDGFRNSQGNEQSWRAGEWKGEFNCLRKEGNPFLSSLVVSPVRDAEGKFLGIGGVFRDTTERKRKEREILECVRDLQAVNAIGTLLSSPEKFDESLEAAFREVLRIARLESGALFLIEPSDGKLQVRVNRGIPDLFVRKIREQAVEARLPGLVGEERSPLVVKVAESGADLRSWFQGWDRVPGSLAWILLEAKGNPAGAMALAAEDPEHFEPRLLETLEAIADRIGTCVENGRAARRMTREKEEWEKVFHSLPNMISVHDEQGKAVLWNRALVENWNLSPGEIQGKTCREVYGWDDPGFPDGTGERQNPIRREIESDRFPGIFLNCVHRDFDPSGKLTGTVCFTREISQEKRLQENLVQSEKLAAIGELVSSVAHELNNPLTAVMGYSQLLLGRCREEKLRRDLERIFSETQRAAKIIQNLLTFARKHKPEKRYLGLNGIIEKTLEFRAYELKVSNIRVETDLQPDLPKTMLDFHQIQQVFLNLITNAEQALLEKGGGGRLRLRTREREGRIRIEVEDDGPGVPEGIREKVFEPFFTTKEEGKGTGLGLGICQGIVKEHDGTIAVTRGEWGGACFLLEFPILREDPSPQHGEDGPPPISSPALRPRRILVVDDEPNIQDFLHEFLRMEGYDVDTASTGDSALKKINRGPYDLIISDMKLPGLNGREFYEEVRRRNADLARRILFASGDVVSPETRRFIQETGNAEISKPFDLKVLRGLLSKQFPAPAEDRA